MFSSVVFYFSNHGSVLIAANNHPTNYVDDVSSVLLPHRSRVLVPDMCVCFNVFFQVLLFSSLVDILAFPMCESVCTWHLFTLFPCNRAASPNDGDKVRVKLGLGIDLPDVQTEPQTTVLLGHLISPRSHLHVPV